jgi:hypothetical protein
LIKRQIGEIDLALSFIEANEGLYNEALQSQMRAHKLIKSPYHWEESIVKTFKLLVQLEKFSDADSFLEKLMTTLQDCLKNKDFEDSHMKLGWCLAVACLCKIDLYLRMLTKNFDKEKFKEMTSKLKQFVGLANKYGANLVHNLIVTSLMEFCEREMSKKTISNEADFKNSYRLANTFIKVGHKMDHLSKANLKYIYSPSLESKIRSPLVTFHNRMKLSLARLYTIFGDLSLKANSMRISIKKIEAVEAEEDAIENEQDPEQSQDLLKDLPDKHKAYLMQLTKEVEKLSLKSKKRLDNYERASALAKEVENTSFLPEDITAAKIEYFRGLRRKNFKIGNLRLAETDRPGASNMDFDEIPAEEKEKYEVDMMIALKEIKELTLALCQHESPEAQNNGIFDYCRSEDVFRTLKRVYYEELEIWTGRFHDPEETIAALMKFQDYQAMDYLLSVVDHHCRKTSRQYLLRSLLQQEYQIYNFLDKQLLDELNKNHKLSNFFNARGDFFEMTDKMPVNAAYLSLQLSEDGSDLFVGFVRRVDQDRYVYDVRKFRLPETSTAKLDQLVVQQANATANYYKTPLLTKSDLKALEQDTSHTTTAILKDLEALFSGYLDYLNEFINKPPPQEVVEEAPQGPGGKPGTTKPKDPVKKPDPKTAGKKDTGLAPENIAPSKSGIEQLVLLVDERYILLPFHLLQLFKEVPILAKDYSLQTYTRRLQSFSPENGGESLILKKTQYIAYDFKDPEGELDEARTPIKFGTLIAALKDNTGVQLTGVNSTERIPSIGNWQLSLREADTLIYFGNKPLLHLLSPATLLDLANSSKVRSFIINDRLNPLKKHISKFESLDEDQELIILKEMPRLTLALLTLMGAGVVLYNQGPIDPEYNLEQLYGILSSLTSSTQGNLSFSNSLAHHREGRKTLQISESEKPRGPVGFPRQTAEPPPQAQGGKPQPKPTMTPAQSVKEIPGAKEGYEKYPDIMVSHFSVIGVGCARIDPREVK